MKVIEIRFVQFGLCTLDLHCGKVLHRIPLLLCTLWCNNMTPWSKRCLFGMPKLKYICMMHDEQIIANGNANDCHQYHVHIHRRLGWTRLQMCESDVGSNCGWCVTTSGCFENSKQESLLCDESVEFSRGSFRKPVIGSVPLMWFVDCHWFSTMLVWTKIFWIILSTWNGTVSWTSKDKIKDTLSHFLRTGFNTNHLIHFHSTVASWTFGEEVVVHVSWKYHFLCVQGYSFEFLNEDALGIAVCEMDTWAQKNDEQIRRVQCFYVSARHGRLTLFCEGMKLQRKLYRTKHKLSCTEKFCICHTCTAWATVLIVPNFLREVTADDSEHPCDLSCADMRKQRNQMELVANIGKVLERWHCFTKKLRLLLQISYITSMSFVNYLSSKYPLAENIKLFIE